MGSRRFLSLRWTSRVVLAKRPSTFSDISAMRKGKLSRGHSRSRQAGHRETDTCEIVEQGGALLSRELNKWWPHRRPVGVAAVTRDRGFERRDHRILRKDAADFIQRRLPFVGVGVLPSREEPRNSGRVHIRGGTDAARAPVPQAL